MKKSVLSNRLLGTAVFISFICAGAGGVPASDYKVRVDDKLKVQIYQYPELSGDYTVTSNGVISIAPIGEIPVAGMSAREISTLVSNRFIKAGLSDKPGTTVNVLQYRPIYVLGDVQKPGEYAYRPGVNILQAISLAGGYFRMSDPGLMRLERDAIHIKGDLRHLSDRYYYLVARRARLNAELELRGEASFPPELSRRGNDDLSVARIIDEERSLLNINVTSVKGQLESLENSRSLYEREIEAISRQIQAGRREADSVQRELNEVKGLYSRGLAPVSRKSGLERTQAQLEGAEQGYEMAILRAQQNIAQVDQKIFALQNERRAKINSELQKVRVELEETLGRIDTNRKLLVEAQFTTPVVAASTGEATETRSFVVVRMKDNSAVSLRAEELFELQPGDVVKVQRSNPLPLPGFGTASMQVPE